MPLRNLHPSALLPAPEEHQGRPTSMEATLLSLAAFCVFGAQADVEVDPNFDLNKVPVAGKGGLGVSEPLPGLQRWPRACQPISQTAALGHTSGRGAPAQTFCGPQTNGPSIVKRSLPQQHKRQGFLGFHCLCSFSLRQKQQPFRGGGQNAKAPLPQEGGRLGGRGRTARLTTGGGVVAVCREVARPGTRLQRRDSSEPEGHHHDTGGPDRRLIRGQPANRNLLLFVNTFCGRGSSLTLPPPRMLPLSPDRWRGGTGPPRPDVSQAQETPSCSLQDSGQCPRTKPLGATGIHTHTNTHGRGAMPAIPRKPSNGASFAHPNSPPTPLLFAAFKGREVPRDGGRLPEDPETGALHCK